MKWGKKKTTSSPRPSLISHVLPTSWLTKFKQMSIHSAEKHATEKGNGKKRNSVPVSSPWLANGGEGGRFYGKEGDDFWRISFGQDGTHGRNDRCVGRPVWPDDKPEFPPCCQSCKIKGNGEMRKFNDMVSEVRKMRELPRKVEILPEMGRSVREKAVQIRTPRLRIERLRKRNQGVFKEREWKLGAEPYETENMPKGDEAKNIFEMEPARRMNGIIEREDCLFVDDHIQNIGFSAGNLNSNWQKLKEMKIKEVKSRKEEQRKSLHVSRELQRKRPKQNSRVRVYSPRTASKTEICRVKALEDMKKAKLKMKRAREKAMKGFMGLESFAVVKSSFDPQRDFRDSMMEMIEEKKISRAEEMEELLACYLTLNSDEYHDLIIKVFRQVWLQLKQASSDSELECEKCCFDGLDFSKLPHM